jgi:hypothetical protein
MMAEAFRRLGVFGNLEHYRYIGFGSVYFADFALLHKTLGITNMVSIERDAEKQARFDANKPYNCIKMVYKNSNDYLPTIQWDVRSIVWLDYDSQLTSAILADITFFISKAIGGSVLLVTIDADPITARPSDTDDDSVQATEPEADLPPLQLLRDRVGANNVKQVRDRDLRGWRLADTYRRIINAHIADVLNDRNGGRTPGSRYRFEELFYFLYRDGARMMTLGGVLYDEGQSSLVASCQFDALEYCKASNFPYHIPVPKLTPKERRELDAFMPIETPADIAHGGVPSQQITDYAKVYRYFPNYADVDI